MSRLCTALYIIVALINTGPIIGAYSAARLEGLYAIEIVDPDLLLLMRHRAILLGIVGGILFLAAFHPSARPIALATGFVSMLSFIVLIGSADQPGAALTRVMWVDIAAVGLLGVAWVID